MESTNQKLTLAEVCALTGVNQRTVRFYIQKGLVDRPVGLKKAAYYTREHVRQLLEIEKWKGVGMTLEGIREVMIRDGDDLPLPPPPREPG
ncbi:MAG: MerR family transcriptional regulator, partial [Deltaproteobacteria bacterium]|nr:MerR family transcriptional regulator [Deltaproteobacteria bacterium]